MSLYKNAFFFSGLRPPPPPPSPPSTTPPPTPHTPLKSQKERHFMKMHFLGLHDKRNISHYFQQSTMIAGSKLGAGQYIMV